MMCIQLIVICFHSMQQGQYKPNMVHVCDPKLTCLAMLPKTHFLTEVVELSQEGLHGLVCHELLYR